MRARRTSVIASGAALAAAALVGGTGRATVPGPNGPIVYEAMVGKHSQLFTINPDGSGVRQLTRFSGSDSLHASWSPDGRTIAFERDFPKHAGVYTMNADGSNVVALTPKGLQGMPAYSPDGKTIVFDRTLPKEDALWLMNPDGSGLRQLTHNRRAGKGECRCDASPVFSPDGRQIAFRRELDSRRSAVLVVNANGTGLRRLTPFRRGVAGKIDWSPDGSRILFSSPQFERPGPSNVFTIRPDGSALTQLTHETRRAVNDLADSFSPDGTRILFARVIDGGPFRVFAMNADGTGATRLTPPGADAHWANWARRAG